MNLGDLQSCLSSKNITYRYSGTPGLYEIIDILTKSAGKTFGRVVWQGMVNLIGYGNQT